MWLRDKQNKRLKKIFIYLFTYLLKIGFNTENSTDTVILILLSSSNLVYYLYQIENQEPCESLSPALPPSLETRR